MADDDIDPAPRAQPVDPAPRAELVDPAPASPPPDTADTAKDPNMPADSPLKDPQDPGAEAQSSGAEAYVNSKINAYKQARSHMDDMEKYHEGAVREFQRTWAQPDSTPPQLDPLPQRPMQDRRAFTGLAYGIPILGAIGLAIAGFGGKRATGMRNFLGAAMKAYSQGRRGESQQQTANWWKDVEYTQKVNSERLANYRAALQDKRLNLQQQLDVVHTYADEFKDSQMAATKSWEEAKDTINRYQNAQKNFANRAAQASKQAHHLLKSPAHNEWENRMKERFREDTGRLPQDFAEMQSHLQANHQWTSYEEYMKNRKQEGKPDTSGKLQGMPDDDPNAPITDDEARKMRDRILGSGE
jgi:hypothetical protein